MSHFSKTSQLSYFSFMQVNFYLKRSNGETRSQRLQIKKIHSIFITLLVACAPSVLLYLPSAPLASLRLYHLKIGWSNF